MKPDLMKLKVLLPTEVLLDEEVTKIVAEAPNGYFCLLPRHIDFVSALVPGILSCWDSEENETFMAVDEGIIVKYGPQVLVSTQNAALGTDLGVLQQLIEETFNVLDEREQVTRSALARMEADFIRRLIELK
jgi:F-type H+-transporting ATPase subunit epsilon